MNNPINEISKAAHNSALLNTDELFHLSGMGKSALPWSGKAYEIYRESVFRSYSSITEIRESYSLKKYENELINFFREEFLANVISKMKMELNSTIIFSKHHS